MNRYRVQDAAQHPDAVYVGRPSGRYGGWRGTPWRNSYVEDKPGDPRDGDRATVVAKFRADALQRMVDEPDWLAPLRGKDLLCWCTPAQPCHADVLLELANREDG